MDWGLHPVKRLTRNYNSASSYLPGVVLKSCAKVKRNGTINSASSYLPGVVLKSCAKVKRSGTINSASSYLPGVVLKSCAKVKRIGTIILHPHIFMEWCLNPVRRLREVEL
jgi:hypothetical protein